MRNSLPLVSLILLFSAPSAKAADDIWHLISARSLAQVFSYFTRMEPLRMASGKKVNVADEVNNGRFAIDSCKTRLLSLGEGRSTFILSALLEREQRLEMAKRFTTLLMKKRDEDIACGLKNLHAVDIAYPAHDENGKVTDTRAKDTQNRAGLESYDEASLLFIRKFPTNYHSALFQKLDLRTPDGKRMKFTHIVSFMSLGVIVAMTKTEAELEAMIDKILEHLDDEGRLIIYPFNDKPNPMTNYLYRYAAQLKSKGKIDDYSLLEQEDKGLKDVRAFVLIR